MAKNRSAAGITNIVQYDANRNITFVSGSTTLLTVSSSGALTTTGTITAQTLVVQTVTSSVNFITGSTKFGSLIGNTHQFTGSVTVTGSLAVVTNGTEFQVNATGVNLGNISTDAHTITGSMAVTGGLVDINRAGQSLRIFPQTSSGSARIQLQNSGSGGLAGANAIIAVESSTGADQFTGTSPFSFVIGTATQKAFHLGANSAVVMTVTGSNVGIGTSSPSAKLTLIGGEMRWGFTSDMGALSYTGGNPMIQALGALDMLIATNGSERMRITSAGNVGIAGTAGSGRLQVWGEDQSGSNFSLTTYNSGGFGMFFVRNDGNIRTNSGMYGNTTSGTTRSVFVGNGDYYLGGISSIRASKKNIENISNIDWIHQLTPVTFNYRKKDEEGNYTEDVYDELNYGLIAEDTAPVADFLINYNDKEDGTKEIIGIEYMRLITPMLKAIQELKSQNDFLQQQINELKA